jgi:outer membrane lipoprotein-sorting protein
MASVYSQDNSRDTSLSASFEIFDQEAHRSQKHFTYRRIGSPGSRRTLVVFTDPEPIRGVALLSIERPGVPPAQYLYTPATGRVRSVAPQQRTARFLGTDFSFEDIQPHALEDFSYRLLGSGDVIDGRRTYRIEATPVLAANSQYRSIDYWVDQDSPVILRADMYDQQGTKLRTEHASEVRRVSGIWGARRTEMQTPGEGTRTVLLIHEVKVNTGLDERQFTPEALEAAPAPQGTR